MKHLKKFNENIDVNDSEDDSEDGGGKVFVKDIIEYLTQFDPNMEVFLDKDGWQYSGQPGAIGNGVELIKQSGLFDEFDGVLFINN